MKHEIQVHLFGSLRATVNAPGDLPIRTPLDGPVPVNDIIDRMGIARHDVQLVMVNHKAVARATRIQPGDRLALFPREYPFFADWKDYRFL